MSYLSKEMAEIEELSDFGICNWLFQKDRSEPWLCGPCFEKRYPKLMLHYSRISNEWNLFKRPDWLQSRMKI